MRRASVFTLRDGHAIRVVGWKPYGCALLLTPTELASITPLDGILTLDEAAGTEVQTRWDERRGIVRLSD